MKKRRTRSVAGEALASPSFATLQLPLPLLEVLADTRTAFFGRCLEAGQEVLLTLMEADRTQLCGPSHVPDPQRRRFTFLAHLALQRQKAVSSRPLRAAHFFERPARG